GLHALLAADDSDVAELVFEFGLSRAQELLAVLVQERYRIDFRKWDEVAPRQLAQRWDERWHKVIVPRLLRNLAESEPARRILNLLHDNLPANAVMQARRDVLLEQIPLLVIEDEPEQRLNLLRDNARVQGGGTTIDWDSEEIYSDVKDALTAFRN